MQLNTFLSSFAGGEVAAYAAGIPVNTQTIIGNIVGAALITLGKYAIDKFSIWLTTRKNGNS